MRVPLGDFKMSKPLHILFLVAVALLAGCSQQPSITHTERAYIPIETATADGLTETRMELLRERHTEIIATQDLAQPATLIDLDWSASTGVAHAIDQAMTALSAWAGWLSMGLIAFGVGSLVFRYLVGFKIVPVYGSMLFIAGGVLLLAFPVLVDRYAGTVLVALAAGGAMYAWSMWDNWGLTRESTRQ